MTMISFKSHYELLGIEDEKESLDIITKNYKYLILKYHPDKNIAQQNETNGNSIQHSNEMFDLIHKAYNILRDPIKRELYDQGLYERRYKLPGVINETLEIWELDQDEEGWFHPCRCGDQFFLPFDDPDFLLGLSVIVNCSNCSLLIQVIPSPEA